MYQIKLKNTEKEPIWIIPPKLSIGCADDNDVIINKAGIKQHHADLVIKDNGIYLLPDESANDVSINGKAINTAQPVKTSDVIRLCNIELEILEPKSENAPIPVIQDSVSDKWYIEIISGSNTGERHALKKLNIIGRSPECEIIFSEDNISRKHARLDIIGGALKITDMGSANGCLINGTKITSAYARPGDTLKIGQVEVSINGPFLDADKTVIGTPLERAIETETSKQKKTNSNKNNTLIRREQILESKQALQNLNNQEDKKTQTLIWVSAIILTLVMLSSAIFVSL
ncbi:MAG: FHA domain-containing protein [Pseudomonadales bacterium]|nr:FHA domain-containing protein [Pseudomonadales bacterium]